MILRGKAFGYENNDNLLYGQPFYSHDFHGLDLNIRIPIDLWSWSCAVFQSSRYHDRIADFPCMGCFYFIQIAQTVIKILIFRMVAHTCHFVYRLSIRVGCANGFADREGRTVSGSGRNAANGRIASAYFFDIAYILHRQKYIRIQTDWRKIKP